MPKSITVGDIVAQLTEAFSDAQIDAPRVEARVLVAHTLQLEPSMLFARSKDIVADAKLAEIHAVKERRLAHEPVARIRGYREFYGADYLLGPATLEPRADSETLVEAVLASRPSFTSRPVRILDLGTGTGCLLIAIARAWPEVNGLGVDLAQDAVAVATQNAVRLNVDDRVRFQTGDWCHGLAGSFDIVISNPPYITDDEMEALAPEVRDFDPVLALNAGPDGLAAYRALVPQIQPLLASNGSLFLEVGAGQAADVQTLCGVHGLSQTVLHRDLAGIERVVQASPI